MPPTGTTSPLRPTGSAFPTLPGVLSSSDNDTDAEAQHLLNRRTRRNRQYTGNTTDSADATTNATSSSSSGGSSTAFGSTSALVAASRASQNVPRTFAFNVMDGAAFSLWQQTVFQQFVYDLAHKSNAVVGYISGVMGAAQVIAAIVGSVAADKKLKRETVMRIGSFFGFFGALLTAYGVYQKSLPCLYIASLGWGGYVGLNNPAVEALFADSVATVHRTTVYTQKWMACVASYLVGYAVTLVLFWRVGDHWKMWEMAIVMYCGLGLHTVAFAILWTIRDRNKLAPVASSTPASASARTLSLTLPRGASTMSIDENIPAETPLQGPSYMRTYCEACMANGVVPDDNANTSIRDGLCTTCWNGTGHNTARGGQHDAAASLAVGSLGARSVVSDGPVIPEDGADLDHREAPAASGQPQPSGTATSAPATSVTATSTVAPPSTATPTDEDIIPFPECLKTKQGIPYYICAGDFIASFGAGMTLRYFPLFFIHDYDVNPTTLTIVFAVVTIVTTFTASLVKLAAVKVFRNRVATAIACRLVGSGAMFYMAFAEGVFAKLVPILIVFVVRMAIMNSIFGITRSVIMDHAPPSQRARWSAVESLCGFTWAGSAVVGGLIADAHGYRATFQVTGCVHTVAALVLIPAAMMITDGVFKETAPAAKPNADAATVHVEDEEHHTRQRRLPRKRREASTRAVTTEEHGEEEAPNHDRHDDAPPPGDHTADAPTGVFCAGPDQPGCFVSVPNERPPRPQGAEVRIDDDDDDEPVPPVGSVNRC